MVIKAGRDANGLLKIARVASNGYFFLLTDSSSTKVGVVRNAKDAW